MGKRKKKTGPKKASSKPKETPDTSDAAVPTTEEPGQFDFGGVPNRNLKKNLGCG